ncbi:MAG: DUF4097 family beta strand repeat-containing protein [Bacillota bacterium]
MKSKFLLELRRYLAPLNEEERTEIVRFYEERFHTGIVYEGKTEQDIIDELESPRQIAMNVLDEYGYSQTDISKEQKHSKQSTPEEQRSISNGETPLSVWNIVLVILFDIFIVSAAIPMIFGLFMGLSAGWFGFLYEIIRLGYNNAEWYTILLSVGILVLWLYIVFWLYDLLITFIIWILRLHLNALSYKKPSSVLRRLKRLKISTYLQRHSGKGKLKNIIGTFALFAIIIGGTFSILHFGTIYTNSLNDMNEYTENYNTTSLSEADALEIAISLAYSDIDIIRTNTDNINIFVKELEEAPVTINYDETNTLLTLDNEFDQDIFSWSFVQSILTSIFRDQPSVIVEIPNDLTIDSVTINGSNGDIFIRDVTTNDDITIDTMNGKIALSNISANSINGRTSNGKITVTSATVEETMQFDTSNGQIVGDMLIANIYDFDSSNGSITLSNIDVEDKDGFDLNVFTSNGDIDVTNVYVKNAILNTSNGDITFTNSDLTFVFDSVDTNTSNGDVDVNIPKN